MSDFEPELGQMFFGQPSKKYALSEITEAALISISTELERVMWNIKQRAYESPFYNTGNVFECDTFKVHAYSWSDDEQPWNFLWKDIEISWYKCCGRGASSSKKITADMASEMLDDCLRAVRNYKYVSEGKTRK